MTRGDAEAAALSALPGMGPATLARLLSTMDPGEAWRKVCSGEVRRPPRRSGQDGLFDPSDSDPSAQQWARAASVVDAEQWWRAHAGTGTGVTWLGDGRLPAVLASDPEPPGVLFYRGDLSALDGVAVAIVGTRSATPGGISTAYSMGRDLAAAGLPVVSGMALGIDGAAHRGVLDAVGSSGARAGRPIGVAASGVDVPYPRRHAGLWEGVCRHGLMISETPPGRPAQAWRFPMRNRLIAALSALVVVVESHATGGSLITASAALERGVEVRVVPGPVGVPSCAGSNQLLYDGPGPVRDATDVLDTLGIVDPDRRPHPGDRLLPLGPPGGDPGAAAVLRATLPGPVTLGQIVERTGLPPGRVAAHLGVLEEKGLVAETFGWWARTGAGSPSR